MTVLDVIRRIAKEYAAPGRTISAGIDEAWDAYRITICEGVEPNAVYGVTLIHGKTARRASGALPAMVHTETKNLLRQLEQRRAGEPWIGAFMRKRNTRTRHRMVVQVDRVARLAKLEGRKRIYRWAELEHA
jgi:hypothetical protein